VLAHRYPRCLAVAGRDCLDDSGVLLQGQLERAGRILTGVPLAADGVRDQRPGDVLRHPRVQSSALKSDEGRQITHDLLQDAATEVSARRELVKDGRAHPLVTAARFSHPAVLEIDAANVTEAVS